MKQISRRVILNKRNRLTKDKIIEKSAIIKEKLFSSHAYKTAKTIMFYVSFGSEVKTDDMITEALEEKKVCVPVTDDHHITPALIESYEDLNKKGKYNIPEPSVIKKINKDNIDLVIVPGVVFDKENHRIGYGKGYYDKFMKDIKAKKIRLAFDLQLLQIIPKDEWDIRLDKVITEV